MLKFFWLFFTGLAALCSFAMGWLTLDKFAFISRDVAHSYIFVPLVACAVTGTALSGVEVFRRRAQRRAASTQSEAAVQETPAVQAEAIAGMSRRWKLGLGIFWGLTLVAAVAALYVVHINNMNIRIKLEKRLTGESDAGLFRTMDESLKLSLASIYAFMATGDRTRFDEAEKAQDSILRGCEERLRQQAAPWFSSLVQDFKNVLKREREELALLGDMNDRLQVDRNAALANVNVLQGYLRKLTEELNGSTSAYTELFFFGIRWAETSAVLGQCLMPGAGREKVESCLQHLTGMWRELDHVQREVSSPRGQAAMKEILLAKERLESTMRQFAKYHAQLDDIYDRVGRGLRSVRGLLGVLLDKAEQLEWSYSQEVYGAAKKNIDKLALLWLIAIMASGLLAWLTSFPATPRRVD